MSIYVMKWTGGYRGIVLQDNQMILACVQVHNNRNAAMVDAAALRREVQK